MATTQGRGDFTNDMTASGSLIAGSGAYSESLTVSGVPVFLEEFVAKFVRYTGSGVSGKTVELTGINRAHLLYFHRTEQTGTVRIPTTCTADGDTGDVIRRNTQGVPAQDLNLDAPPAGASQTLTINTFSAHINELDGLYRIFAIGTST